ncbi:MAG TPA: class I SAM-dependent methyltransferase [Candidatus Angelobacter sp.]|nr:class I SAM-dependent methyltransferase [Candidatus Angelobacter sp.]
MSTPVFYDELSRYYHLIYADWEASIDRQARALDSIIRTEGGPEPHTILDCTCGIGTQSLGLAARGYEVTASDLSPATVERARLEARQRGLSLQVSVADMRSLYKHHGRTFDVVLSCDNSVPHLLSNEDILTALRQFYKCTKVGGLCLVSLRDYSAMDFNSQIQLHPYGVRDVGDVRYVLFQVWDLKPPLYDTTFYVIEQQGSSPATVHSTKSTYYAVTIPVIIQLMEEAQFQDVRRIEDVFFQPIIVGHKRK